MNNKIRIMAILLLGMAGTAMADYAQTTIYFSVPSSTTFSNTYLDGGSNASEGSFPPATVGASYFFNSTTGYNPWIQPCSNAATWGAGDVRCQNGNAKPFVYTTNTGTVDQSFWFKFNSALPIGVLTCINSTKRVAADATTYKTSCTLGDLNETNWAKVGLVVAPTKAINVTIFANFSAVAGGTNSRTLYTNSTV